MISYGIGPSTDEIEIIIFGPGFGEAIAVHLGEDQWLLVDSCINPKSKLPASSEYLDQIGVGIENVKVIVASHWHDDHVRGISKLASKYPSADFLISGVFNENEARAFLAAYGGSVADGLARGAKELFSVIDGRETVYPVLQRSIVIETLTNGRSIRATALSPSPVAFAQSLAHFAQYLPTKARNEPITHAPELKPNLEAVAIHIDLGDEAILLGSDLEDDGKLGWSAVVSDGWCQNRRKATLYKVAHHGSNTGDHQKIWIDLLKAKPIACLSPFNNGRHRLPTENDKNRIRARVDQAYITSGATRRPDMDNAQLKRLGDICKNLSRVNSGFGSVRLRKKYGQELWRVENFGKAQHL